MAPISSESHPSHEANERPREPQVVDKNESSDLLLYKLETCFYGWMYRLECTAYVIGLRSEKHKNYGCKNWRVTWIAV